MPSKKKSTPAAEPIQAAPSAPVTITTEPTAPWRGKLTERQEEIAELAADMIINGGNSTSVNTLLWAALHHKWLRISGDLSSDAADREKEASDYAARHKAEYFRDLARHWPEQPHLSTSGQIKARKGEDPEPTTVTEMIRANYRKELRSRFESFMRSQDGLEDTYLLYEIFVNYDSMSGELGESFAYVLDTHHTYIKVPWEHLKRVEAVIKLLTEDPPAKCA